MTYVKPGVEIEQVQTTVSPSFASPTLGACIIGLGYSVVETTDDVDVYDSDALSTVQKYSNSSEIIAYLNISGILDASSVYIDINEQGSWYHVGSNDYSVDATAKTVTIVSGLGTKMTNGTIRVGYRATTPDINKYFVIDSLSDLEDKVGKPVSYNPLAYGAAQALNNAGATVAVYGVTADTTDAHGTARDDLALQEVYALAPMTHQNVHSAYAAHVDTMSLPTNKKERIVFLNPKWTWYESDGTTSVTGPLDDDMDKTGTCTALSAEAFAVAKRRTFYIRPDTVYISESRPIATLKQSYVVYGHSLAVTYGLYARFAEAWTYRPGTTSQKKYYTGDNITDTALVHLMDNTYGYVQQEMVALIPVPGYYLAAGIAGQVSGQYPEQGFTNLALAGDYSELKYSGDFFSEAQLNILAGGGNWIMWQTNVSSPIVTRHQQSTDVSSIELKELSITKTLDYVAKFVRTGLIPYIGKYNITEAFLKMIRTILSGLGTFLRREGRINDLKVVKVEQDSVSKDTILVTLTVLVKYPVNYIRIILQF